MHVKDLHVTRYGPMTPFEHDGFAPFTLIHGPNEQGKTLLIDALFKLLFKKELKKSREKRFGNMRRVSEQPEGYVVLRDHAREVKLENDETLSMFSPGTVTPEDFRNVFLIRDSDLRLDDEKEYYNHITEKLTGLRSSEITALLKIIQRKGRLRAVSPDSGLVNSAEQGKWADRLRDARRVVEQIRTLCDELAFARYDELNDELVELRRRRRGLEEERECERAIERWRQFERARAALTELDEFERVLATMEGIDYRTFKEWQRATVEREHLEKDIERGEKAAARTAKDRDRAERDVKIQRGRSAEADGRVRRLEKELSQRIDEYQHDRLEFRRWDTVSGLARRGCIAGAAVTLAALVAYVVRPSNIVATLGGVALLVTLRTGWGIFRHHRARADLERRAGSLCNDAARLGLRVDSVLDLQSAIGDLERELAVLREEERAAEAGLERVVAEQGGQLERMEAQRRRLAEIDAEIAAFKSGTHTSSLDDYQAAIDRRRSAEASLKARRELLQGLVPVSSTGADAVAEWRAAVDAALAGEAPDDDGSDPDRSDRVDKEIRDITAREGDVSTRLSKGGKQIYSAQLKATELRILDDIPRCRTIHDLEHLSGLISDYCLRIEREQALAHDAVRVFLDIDARERERVGDLFGPNAPVSTVFHDITGGRYRAVTYDVEADQIYVERNDGRSVRATALSGGAYDQLYLAIRLSIADRLAAPSRGFFVMDDPFIKADTERLERLMDTLRRIVRQGWQVLYFSAKKEVLETLAGDIAAGHVQLIELNRTLFSPASWSQSVTPRP